MTTYHHGNLREALLTEARKQLIESGPDKLSLRALARAIGVSQTAPYRHFPDKTALLVALTIEAFNELNEKIWIHTNKIEDANERLIEVAVAYIDYACENQELYKFMFGPVFERRFEYPDLKAACAEGLMMICDTLKEMLSSDDPDVIWNAVVSCRAFVHGLAMMRIDGEILESPMGAGEFDVRKAILFMQRGISGFSHQ